MKKKSTQIFNDHGYVNHRKKQIIFILSFQRKGCHKQCSFTSVSIWFSDVCWELLILSILSSALIELQYPISILVQALTNQLHCPWCAMKALELRKKLTQNKNNCLENSKHCVQQTGWSLNFSTDFGWRYGLLKITSFWKTKWVTEV